MSTVVSVQPVGLMAVSNDGGGDSESENILRVSRVRCRARNIGDNAVGLCRGDVFTIKYS